MTKHSQKNRLARLEAKQKDSKRSSRRQPAHHKPILADTDFMMMKWLNSLSPQDRALYDSQFRPSPPSVTSQKRSLRPQDYLRPSDLVPRKTDPPPGSAEGKKLASLRKLMASQERRRADMRHVNARLQSFIAALPAEEQDEIHNGWKKDIRPFREAE